MFLHLTGRVYAMMLRAFHIALKDLLVWLRDPSALGILLGMPAVLIVILGSALGGLTSGGGSTRIAVGIVNLDSRLLARPNATTRRPSRGGDPRLQADQGALPDSAEPRPRGDDRPRREW